LTRPGAATIQRGARP